MQEVGRMTFTGPELAILQTKNNAFLVHNGIGWREDELQYIRDNIELETPYGIEKMLQLEEDLSLLYGLVS